MTDTSQPLISIDVVPLRFVHETGNLQVATSPRIYEPFIGHFALPGVLLLPGESLHSAASRALRVKTGLDSGFLKQIAVFDGTNRDPRGATISISFLSIQDETTVSDSSYWENEDSVPQLPFDHNEIIKKSIERMKESIWNDVPLTRALLGDSFTTKDAVALKSPSSNVTNASRWLRSYDHVRAVENDKNVSSGRPPLHWEWV